MTIPTVKPQEPTSVCWRDRADAHEATALAELIGADGARMIDPASRPLQEGGVDLFVEVGSAPDPPAPAGQRRPSC